MNFSGAGATCSSVPFCTPIRMFACLYPTMYRFVNLHMSKESIYGLTMAFIELKRCKQRLGITFIGLQFVLWCFELQLLNLGSNSLQARSLTIVLGII